MGKKNVKPQLTISLLASNRPDTIRRCLDSLKPIMEAIPSELILVDTSKNPDIHKILLEYTDQVYEFEWCNDFAKARNVGLKKARGEWFMFLDDDEWFVDIDELVQFFRSGEYRSYGCVDHRIRNFMDVGHVSYNDCWVTRLYRIEKDAEFHSKVHEYYAPIRAGKKKLYAMSYHSGYAFATKEKERAHYERNVALLYDMIAEEPENMRWKMQLAQEYAAISEWEKLEKHCKECIDQIETGVLGCLDAHLCCFFSGYVYAIGMQERYEEALTVMDEIMKHSRCVDILKWQLYYRYTENYLKTRQWDKAEAFAKRFIEASEDEQKQKQVIQVQNSILLLGEAFNKGRVAKTYAMLIVCGLKHGSTQLLCELYEKLQWDMTSYIVANDTLGHLVEAIATLPYDPIFGKLITDAHRNMTLRPLMSLEAEKYKSEDKECYERVIYAFAQADSDDGYIWRAKLQVADWTDDADKVIEELKKGFALSENVFNAYKVVEEITSRYSIDLCEYWTFVPSDNWKISVRSHFISAEEDAIVKSIEQVRRVFDEEAWQRRFYEMYLAKRDLEKDSSQTNLEKYVAATYRFYGKYYQEESSIIDADYEELSSRKSKAREELLTEVKDETYDDVKNKFHNYMVCVLEYYLTLYTDEAFMGDMEILPPEARAAVWLNELFGKDEADFEGRIASLRECAKACKSLGEKVKVFARLLGEQKLAYESSQARNANNELVQMIEVMKDKICQMIEQGLKEEAREVLTQVRVMAPTDQELLQMEKMLS